MTRTPFAAVFVLLWGIPSNSAFQILPTAICQTSCQDAPSATCNSNGDCNGRFDVHVTDCCCGFMAMRMRSSLTVKSPLTTLSPASSGMSSVNAPCVGATRYTVVFTRQSRSSSSIRSTRANTGNRLLSQRTAPSPSLSACSLVSCSEPEVRRLSLVPATNQASLLTSMTLGGVRKGISRLSTAGIEPRNVTLCRPGTTCIQSVLFGDLRMRTPPAPFSETISGRHPAVEPGKGIATVSRACTDNVMLTV